MTFFLTTILVIISQFNLYTNYAANMSSPITISGTVFNEAMEPLTGASLTIRTVDSTLLSQTVSDSQGYYQIKVCINKEIIIEAKFIGYEIYTSEPMQPIERVLNICLTEKKYVIDEVTVKGKTPLIRMQDGNFIVNTTQIPNVESMTLENLLNRLPGVSTQDGLTLNGKRATLYIDGVKQQIGSKNVLQSLQGAIVQEVELLSMPTAEWGITSETIINIKTKKRKWDGYYLTLGSSADLHRKEHWSNSNNIFCVFKKKNITFNSMISFESTYSNYGTNDTTWYFGGIVQDKVYDFKERLNAVSFLGNLNWESQSGHSLNLNTYIYNDHGRIAVGREIGELDAGNYSRDKFLTNTRGHDDLWSANLEYKSPDSLKTKVTASYGITYGGQRSSNNYLTNHIAQFDKYMDSKLNMIGHIHTIKGVLQQNFDSNKKFTLYSGFKATLGKLNDKTDYRMLTDNPINDTHSRFTGRENTLDLYLQAKYKITEKWSISGYFTATYTNYDLDLKSENIHTKSIYWKYFPYLTLSFSTRNYKSTIGYMTSMTRPNYEWMLPGVRYADKYSYSIGNPDLTPTIQKSVVWNNLLFGYMTIYLSYTRVCNAISNIMIEEDRDKIVYSFMNYADFDRYNFYASVPYELLDGKLSGEIAAGYTYSKLKRSKNGFIVPKGRNIEKYLVTKLDIDYKFTHRLQVSGYLGYSPPQKMIQATKDYRFYFGLGASYSCLKDKSLTFSMQFYDILDRGSHNNNRKNYFSDNYQHIYWRYSSKPRTISFSVRLKLNSGEKVVDKAKGAQGDLERFGSK